jgi:hypothetical protein
MGAWRKKYLAIWKEDPAFVTLVYLAIPASVYVILAFALDPNRSYAFSEYATKFVPFLRDTTPGGWFDGWGMGDPRPRIVTILATLLNLRLREAWAAVATLPPALGINWLLYPLTLGVLYQALRRMRLNRATALGSCLLWGLSPPALDSLVLCYVPAKALTHLWFALALDAAARLEVARSSPGLTAKAASRAAIRLGGVLLLAWLTDETAGIVLLVVLIVFSPLFFGRQPVRHFLLNWSGVAGSLLLFGAVALVAYPVWNRISHQVPLDFLRVIVQGPSVAYPSSDSPAHSIASSHLAGMWGKLRPADIAFTMFSASVVPNREVAGFWTWGSPRGPADWPTREILEVGFFLAILAGLSACLPSYQRGVAMRLWAALAVLILAYTVLLQPIAPAILEINYYGALFSLPFAMLVAVAALGGNRRHILQLLGVLGVAAVALLQVGSYKQTSQRIQRNYSNSEGAWNRQDEIRWNYGTLAALSSAVSTGHYSEAIAKNPFPSRAFCYLFELEANREHRAGKTVDFSPLSPAPTLYDSLLLQQKNWMVRNGRLPPKGPLPEMAAVMAAGGRNLSDAESRQLVQGQRWEGYGEDWGFTRTFGLQGEYIERRWLLSIMRVWQFRGYASVSGPSEIRLADTPGNPAIKLTILRHDANYYAFDADGRCRFMFHLANPG